MLHVVMDIFVLQHRPTEPTLVQFRFHTGTLTGCALNCA